ncbi:MAG: general secretion pathway protein L [Candidatus Azotimanducaceae bacterium]|jgi:general secretion pathway protein L
MAEDLFLRFRDQDRSIIAVHTEAGADANIDDSLMLDCSIEWMLLDQSSGIVRFRGENNLEEFAQVLVDLEWSGSTNVMLCGEEILLTQADIPSKQLRQILQALPFMVEESLAVDIDDCHFSIGDRDPKGKLNVAVIELERMIYWLDIFTTLGLKPDVLTSDVLSVPRSEGCAIMPDGHRVLIRSGDSLGLAIESSLIATTVNLIQDKSELSFLLHASLKDETALAVSQINAEQESEVHQLELEYLPFETLCRQFNQHSINLLQGKFKVAQDKKSNRNTWRSVIVLAACAFIFHIALLVGQGIFLDIKAKEAEADSRRLYAAVFPNDRNVRDIRRRWNSHIGSTDNDGGHFLSLFQDTLKQLPGSNLILNSLNFNEGRGNIVLQLEAPRSELLIQYSQALSKLGLNAEIGTINQGDDSVKGSIKVRLVEGS